MTTHFGDAATRVAGAPGAMAVVSDYLRLTKPRIVLSLLVTTAAAMVVAAGGWPGLGLLVATMVGGWCAAGGANAINQYIDRDIDAEMTRTTGRPVVAGTVTPARALTFGVVLGAVSALVLAAFANALAAALALSGLLLYVGLYTLWLKRSTPHNIVIGGAAGAVPPMVGWAAVTAEIGLPAITMFAIIFFWTPPHFWALALVLNRDYSAVRVPMLPVVAGEVETRVQVLLWSIVMTGVSLLPVAGGWAGGFYLAVALALGAALVGLSVWALRERGEIRRARSVFLYSLLYLMVLFAALAVDAAL